MEKSKFLVTQELYGDFVLIYSTLTTSFVKMGKDIYHRIFEEGDFGNEELTEKLMALGMITTSHADQLKYLDDERANSRESERQHLTIFTTTDCNARCFYCFENGIKHLDMSKEVADATVQFAVRNFPNKELSLGWIGGEPLMKFDTIKYITQKLVQEGFSLSSGVSTNGFLLSKDMIDFLKLYNEKVAIQFSMDAAIGTEYSKIKRYVDADENTAFQRVVDNIALSLDCGLTTDVRINFAASKIDKAKEAFSAIKDMLAGHNLTNAFIFLVPLDLPGSKEIISDYHGNLEHPCLQAIMFQKSMGFGVPRGQRMTPIREKLGKEHGDVVASYALMPQCNICSMTTRYKFVVDSDGTLYKCHRLAGHRGFSCGSVFNGIDLESDSYKQFSETIIHDEQCLECPILPICQGGCIGRRSLCGDNQKCHKIKQVQKELVLLCFEELSRTGKGNISQITLE